MRFSDATSFFGTIASTNSQSWRGFIARTDPKANKQPSTAITFQPLGSSVELENMIRSTSSVRASAHNSAVLPQAV